MLFVTCRQIQASRTHKQTRTASKLCAVAAEQFRSELPRFGEASIAVFFACEQLPRHGFRIQHPSGLDASRLDTRPPCFLEVPQLSDRRGVELAHVASNKFITQSKPKEGWMMFCGVQPASQHRWKLRRLCSWKPRSQKRNI